MRRGRVAGVYTHGGAAGEEEAKQGGVDGLHVPDAMEEVILKAGWRRGRRRRGGEEGAQGDDAPGGGIPWAEAEDVAELEYGAGIADDDVAAALEPGGQHVGVHLLTGAGEEPGWPAGYEVELLEPGGLGIGE